MKVFISWSTPRSMALGKAIKQLLRRTITQGDHWISDEDVGSGTFAEAEIVARLAESTFGFVCLTNENRDRPWPIFEAGALAREVATGGGRLVPVTLDYGLSRLSGPLKGYQGLAATDKIKWQKVVHEMNALTDAPVSSDVLHEHFGAAYSQFEDAVDAIPKSRHKAPREPTPEERIEELTAAVRRLEREHARQAEAIALATDLTDPSRYSDRASQAELLQRLARNWSVHTAPRPREGPPPRTYVAPVVRENRIVGNVAVTEQLVLKDTLAVSATYESEKFTEGVRDGFTVVALNPDDNVHPFTSIRSLDQVEVAE